jgi:RNA polymerase sigma-70 factor (ECF subfamily)
MSEQDRRADQAEFVRLLTQNSSLLFGFILSLAVNRADAEDIFQNTSVILWEKFDSFERGTNFLSWASRVAYFEALAHRRKAGRVLTLSDAAWDALAADALAAVDDPTDWQESLAECLAKLNPDDRRILGQKYFKQQSVAEIAESSSRSVHAVYRALTRAHDQLLRCMRRSTETA